MTPANRVTSLRRAKPAPIPQPARAAPRSPTASGLIPDIDRIPVAGAPLGGGGIVKINARTMLPEEMAVLESVGLQDVKSMTPQAVDVLRAALAEVAGPVPLPVSPDAPPMVMPPVVPLSSLPPEKRAEIRQAVLQANQATPIGRPAPPAYEGGPSLPPGFTNNYPSQTPTSGPVPLSVTRAATLPPQAPKRPPAAATMPEPTPSPPGEAGSQLSVTECPHCGWKLDKPIDPAPDQNDKLVYIQALEGGGRFEKAYRMFGGRLTLWFRSLTPAEGDLAIRQVVIDGQKDMSARVIVDNHHYFRTLWGYRAVLGLAAMQWDGKDRTEFSPIEDMDLDPAEIVAPDTKLRSYIDLFTETYFPTEDLRGIIGNAYYRFDQLKGVLQIRAEDSDFYPAIR